VDEFKGFEGLLRELEAGRAVADDLRRVLDDLGANIPEDGAVAAYGLDELYGAMEECSKFLAGTLA
jgi:hypothetical protein